MRIILLHLLKHFTFEIPPCQLNKYNNDNLSFNDKTLGPRNVFNNTLYEKKLALYIKVNQRNLVSKL